MMNEDPLRAAEPEPFEDEDWRNGSNFHLNPLDSCMGWTCIHCSAGVQDPDVHYSWHRQMYLNDEYGGIVTRTPL
jgi:hypothetical protein